MDLVENAPDGSSEFVPSLPADIEKARSDAAQWATTYRPGAIAGLEAVETFAGAFDAAYADLSALTGSLEDETSQTQFEALLDPLIASTASLLQQTQQYEQSLLAYSNLLDADSQQLNADEASLQSQQANAEAQAEADENAAQEMQDQIDDLNWFQEAWDWLIGDLDDMEDEVEEEENAAHHAQQQADEIGSDLAAVGQSLGAMSSIESSVNSLSNGWATLNGNLAGIIGAEIATVENSGSQTQNLLDAAKADWDNASALAASVLSGL